MGGRRGSQAALFCPEKIRKSLSSTDCEHARILVIFKQDRRHRDVVNDFTEYDLSGDTANLSNLS